MVYTKSEKILSKEIVFSGLEDILSEDNVQIRIFGKPEIKGHRRLGVILASDESVDAALEKAERAYNKLKVEFL